jgi:cytoskeletal protein CcmA (bactofilin family)
VTPPAAQVPPAESPAARVTTTPTPAQSTHSKVSVLGPSIRFKGELIADEDLVIQGQVEGSILHTRSLTIGAQGRVQGDVKARRINVEGTVHGDLYALEGVTLRQGAFVTGNVFANKISISEGARLNGRVDMDKAPTVPNVPKLKAGETAAEASTAAPDLSDAEVSAVLHKS